MYKWGVLNVQITGVQVEESIKTSERVLDVSESY